MKEQTEYQRFNQMGSIMSFYKDICLAHMETSLLIYAELNILYKECYEDGECLKLRELSVLDKAIICFKFSGLDKLRKTLAKEKCLAPEFEDTLDYSFESLALLLEKLGIVNAIIKLPVSEEPRLKEERNKFSITLSGIVENLCSVKERISDNKMFDELRNSSK